VLGGAVRRRGRRLPAKRGGRLDCGGGGGCGGLEDLGGRIRDEQVGGKCERGARTSSTSLFSFFFFAIFFWGFGLFGFAGGPCAWPFEWPNGEPVIGS